MNKATLRVVRRHAFTFLLGIVVTLGAVYVAMAKSPALKSDVWALWHEVTGATPEQCVVRGAATGQRPK